MEYVTIMVWYFAHGKCWEGSSTPFLYHGIALFTWPLFSVPSFTTRAEPIVPSTMPSQEASEDGQQRKEHMPVPLPQSLDAPDDSTATDAETSRQAPQPAKKALKCRNCAQEFSSRSGLWKHLKKPLKQCSQGLRDAMQQYYDTVAGMSDEAHRTLVRLVRRELPTTDPSRDPEQSRVPRCRFCGCEAKSNRAIIRHLKQPRRTCTEALRSKIKEIEEARDGTPLSDDELAEVRRSVLSTSVIKKRKKKKSASRPHHDREEHGDVGVDGTASSVTANSPEAGEAAGGEEDDDEEVIVLEQCRFCGQHVQRLLRHQNKASACRVQRLAAEASIDPASTQGIYAPLVLVSFVIIPWRVHLLSQLPYLVYTSPLLYFY